MDEVSCIKKLTILLLFHEWIYVYENVMYGPLQVDKVVNLLPTEKNDIYFINFSSMIHFHIISYLHNYIW